MLQSLHVKNLALIDEVEVEFSQGLNILTGETGAGKSIIIGSIGLALGGRYSKEILRKGTKYGLVELSFLVEEEEQVRQLEQLDIYPEEDVVVLSRRLMEGRSTCKINGETVTMSQMKAAAGILIDIHGQHEHQSLLYKKNQLQILDAYAEQEIKDALARVGASYKEYKAIETEWKQADLDEASRAKEMSFLEFEIGEIESAGLKQGEDDILEDDFRRMDASQKILTDAEEAYGYTAGYGGDSAGELVSRAMRNLSAASRYDEGARNLYDQLADIENLLNDFNRELSDYKDSLEFSEEDYRQTEDRLNEINRLKTKYGNQIDEIFAYCEEKKERLKLLKDYEFYLQKLEERLKKQEALLKKESECLSKLRKSQAKHLEQEIQAGMQELNFADVKFEIAFSELDHYTAGGIDEVAYLVSMNPGEPLRPLAEVASGGELSRTMLVIKSVMANRDRIETLIFDEIDVGISGRTAQKVSEKMALIGEEHQVICITHLAQIAAMADAHYVIEKTVQDEKTRTDIRLLTKAEAEEELARILGGAEITAAVRENAKEMKLLADQIKMRKE